MTKADVISEISKKSGMDKIDIQLVVEGFCETIKTFLVKGDDVYIRGFGSFTNKKRAEKIARNISKNTSIIIAPHFTPQFKPSKLFIDKIKNSEILRAKLSK